MEEEDGVAVVVGGGVAVVVEPYNNTCRAAIVTELPNAFGKVWRLNGD